MEPVTNPWRALDRELQAWDSAGRQATLWWRDDDCVAPSCALDRLLELSLRHQAPLALAVVPARLSIRLPARLDASEAEVTVLQHGYAHRNHADTTRHKKRELGPDRPKAAVLEELARGAARLAGRFDTERLEPILVPPWNRIDPDLLPALAPLGFRGLSTDGPRPAPEAAPGLVQINCHVDLLRSARRQGALDPAVVIGDLVAHLEARRRGDVDAEEPSGLLSHHLAHDETAWQLLDRLLEQLSGQRAVRWLSAHDIFTAGGKREAA